MVSHSTTERYSTLTRNTITSEQRIFSARYTAMFLS
jgi:hypothetical protein